MKSRSREVNIFNMSILDVLCGALGAFCFMMLALFPYYKPSHLSAEDKQSYHNAQQVQKELQRLRSELKQAGPRVSAEMLQKIEHALKVAQQQLSQTQEALSRTRAAMEQAQQQAQQAEQKAQEAQRQAQEAQQQAQRAQQQAQRAQQQMQQAVASAKQANGQLDMKRPLVIQCFYGPKVNRVTMFIHNPGTGTNGKTAPPFDPSREQTSFFKGVTILEGPGSDSWSIDDTEAGNWPVYYRLDKPQSVNGKVSVDGLYEFDTKAGAVIPSVTLTAAHPWAKAGTIVLDRKGAARFIPASASGSLPNFPESPTQTPQKPPVTSSPKNARKP